MPVYDEWAVEDKGVNLRRPVTCCYRYEVLEMSGQVSPLPLPPEADVEVSVKIHTLLNVTAHAARQKVNRQIALHCGQSFSLGEPELHVGDIICWRVPVWVTHPSKGKVAWIGEVRVDAQTGEVLSTQEQFQCLKAAANGVLQSVDSTP